MDVAPISSYPAFRSTRPVRQNAKARARMKMMMRCLEATNGNPNNSTQFHPLSPLPTKDVKLETAETMEEDPTQWPIRADSGTAEESIKSEKHGANLSLTQIEFGVLHPPLKRRKTKATKRSSTQNESGASQLGVVKPKRKKLTGTRIIRGRIYSEFGKSCHQCRQKTLDFGVSCKNYKTETKQCTIHYCHSCLRNRYGEKAEEMAKLGDWKCPKCRKVCNCSLCMRRRGCYPTGRLVRVAKAIGFSSVSEMLQLESSKEGQLALTSKCKNEHTEGNEKSWTKRSKKNHCSENSTVDESGYSKELNPCKELVLYEGGKYSNGESDAMMQDKSLSINGKGGQQEMFKELENGDLINKSIDGYMADYSDTDERSHDKCQISDEVTSCEEAPCRKNDVDQLRTTESKMHGSEENHKWSAKIEEHKVQMTDKDAAYFHEADGSQKDEDVADEVQDCDLDVGISLPQGSELTNVAEIDMLAEDIGLALQFLEFCEAFAKVFDLKEGQPECLLRELAGGRSSRRSQSSSVVHFHIKLISMILEDWGKGDYSLEAEDGWLQALRICICESQYRSKELSLLSLNLAADGYRKLGTSKKLKLLNFLCDEALSTTKLRSYIDEQNLEFVEEGRKAKEAVLAEREKEKATKRKLRDEVLRAILQKNGVPLSFSEHQDLISKMKEEVTQTLSESLEATDTVIGVKQQCDAVRSEPILLDGNGRRLWKLRGYFSEEHILVQEIGYGDTVPTKDRWSSYNLEERIAVEDYISRQLRQ